MGAGRGSRGRVGGVKRVVRAQGMDAVQRVRRVELLAGVAPVENEGRAQRSFAERQRLLSEALERQDSVWRGMESPSSPLVRRPVARASSEVDDTREPEPLPESFVGLLWWKLRRLLG